MPFTGSHPAIILPLLKLRSRWFSSTGLVIGSMAPDFEYFFRLKFKSSISHTLPGVLLFNLPVTMLLAILFHVFVREQVVKHLPLYFKKRVKHQNGKDWLRYLGQNWYIFAISAVIGSFSHIFWDGFTHVGLPYVQLWPVLLKEVNVFGVDVLICRIIQHTSTVVGFLLILWYSSKQPVVRPHLQYERSKEWLLYWVKVFLFGCGFLLLNVTVRHNYRINGHAIAVIISGWLLALLVFGLYTKLKLSRN